jgi:hypothetical protein
MALVTTTERKEFKPIGRRMDYTWDSLRDLLSRELGADYAALLAEPLSSTGSGTTDWHSHVGGVPRKMSDLDDDAARKLGDRLYDMRLQVHKLADRIEAKTTRQQSLDKAFADALRRAVVVPDDRKYVYAVDGQPVLTEWSHVYIDDNRPEIDIVGEGLLRNPPMGGGTISPPRPVDPKPTVIVVEAPPRRMSWAWLWLLFATIMSVIFYLLLQACGISTFAFDLNFGRFTQACFVAAPSGALDAEAQRRADLLQRIRQAELDLARAQGDCEPPVPPRAEAPPPPPPPPETKPPDGGSTIDDRLRRENAQSGELQITLAWNGLEDLDLFVECPGGSINHATKQACGGELNVDMNYAGVNNRDAVENVTFATAPAGDYVVKVAHAGHRGQSPRSVPFTIRIKRGSNIQTFNGTIASGTQTVHTFTIP